MSSLPSIVPGRGADLAGAHEVRPLETGRRDRKKAATRLAIRSAALALAAERGFARVTIEDIAVVADIAPRTFFNYFPSKESAVLGVDPDRARALCSALADRPADEGPLQALRAVLVEHSQSIVDSFQELGGPIDLWFERFSIVRQDADLLGAYALHVAALERGIVEVLAARLGVDPTADAFPSLVTAAVLSAARVATLNWSANGGVDSLAEMTATAIDALAAGLCDPHIFSTRIDRSRSPGGRGADVLERKGPGGRHLD